MNIPKEGLIEFVNFVNECCAVMDDNYVAEWLNKPHPDLNMDSPMDLIGDDAGREKLYRLLYFIDINEADL
tara:strand:+ start:414 stop:626 length:213 start_codon:yes stop_codon:yes gene_type:complete